MEIWKSNNGCITVAQNKTFLEEGNLISLCIVHFIKTNQLLKEGELVFPKGVLSDWLSRTKWSDLETYPCRQH